MWDVEGGKVALRLAGHEGWVWNIEALDDAHQVLLSGGTDSSVRTWDTRAGRQVQRVDICTGDWRGPEWWATREGTRGAEGMRVGGRRALRLYRCKG